MSEFLTDLIVKEVSDAIWVMVTPLEYQSDVLGETITVRAGFVTDFASIPRIPFIYDVLGNIAHEPAVIHDWLYFVDTFTRKKCDQALLEAMKVNGVSWFKRYQIYWGVRIGGWYAWWQHRRLGHCLASFKPIQLRRTP